jgi:hypothetical protein
MFVYARSISVFTMELLLPENDEVSVCFVKDISSRSFRFAWFSGASRVD